jgi:hypothetical protein
MAQFACLILVGLLGLSMTNGLALDNSLPTNTLAVFFSAALGIKLELPCTDCTCAACQSPVPESERGLGLPNVDIKALLGVTAEIADLPLVAAVSACLSATINDCYIECKSGCYHDCNIDLSACVAAAVNAYPSYLTASVQAFLTACLNVNLCQLFYTAQDVMCGQCDPALPLK